MSLPRLFVKEMVAGKRVRFVRARRGELIYATEDGFEFRVAFSDMGDGVFLPEDSGCCSCCGFAPSRAAPRDRRANSS
ncbi:MAG: hypothetical protein L0219_01530, partial [Phycisphaerales bacterium]|nr:hypothetical protein [Phycisphaerales bacterium]